MHILFLFIKKQAMKAMIEELMDWKKEGCKVVIAGDFEQRPDDGFIILSWDRPIPNTFRQKFEVDTNIVDHIGLSTQISHTMRVQPEA